MVFHSGMTSLIQQIQNNRYLSVNVRTFFPKRLENPLNLTYLSQNKTYISEWFTVTGSLDRARTRCSRIDGCALSRNLLGDI